MNGLKYLNIMLTILALLIGLQLWTGWTQQSAAFVPEAHAQTGLPSPAGQRKEMIDELKKNNQKLDEMMKLLKSGDVRVKMDGN